MEKISILMSAYNSEEYLDAAIKSVLKQTYDNWELVIVDDASEDGSLGVIKRYLFDKRIKLINHAKNRGYGASCLTAINNSDGEIIALLDSDDTLAHNALDVVSGTHRQHKDIGLIYSNYYVCDNNLKVEKLSGWVCEIKPGETNLHNCRTSHFKTFKRRIYNKTVGFDPLLRSAVDKDIVYKIEEVAKTKYINMPLYYYRRNTKGISQGKHETSAFLDSLVSMFNAFRRRQKNGYLNITEKEMSKRLLASIIDCVNDRQWEKLRVFIMEGLKIYPKNLPFLFFLIFGNYIYKKILFKFA